MTQLSKVKQNIHKLMAQPGCYELFLLTVPTEEVARCQYKQFW